MFHCRVLVPLLLSTALLSLDAHAAASLLVDDAGITDAGHCQLESWVRHTGDGLHGTAVPACTLAGTEWSLGLNRAPATPGIAWSAGAKRVLVARDQRRWGLALSAGLGGRQHPPGTDWNLSVPLTLGLDAQDRVQLHLNLGLAREDGIGGHTDGIGMQIALQGRWSLLAEVAHDAARDRGVQVGLRRVLWPGASLDLLGGRQRSSGQGHWITLGFNIAAPP